VEPSLRPVQQTAVAPVLEPAVGSAEETEAQTPYATGAAPVPQTGSFAATPRESAGLPSAGVPSAEPAPAAGGPAGDPGSPSSGSSPYSASPRAPPTAPAPGEPFLAVSPFPSGEAFPLGLGGHHPSARDISAAAAAAVVAAGREASRPAPGSPSVPLPFTGAPPAPAPSGSAPGSGGGAGHDLSGALALLLGAALAGRLLWHARDLLRPPSVFGPIVNEPS
jgi:hypothetical protein